MDWKRRSANRYQIFRATGGVLAFQSVDIGEDPAKMGKGGEAELGTYLLLEPGEDGSSRHVGAGRLGGRNGKGVEEESFNRGALPVAAVVGDDGLRVGLIKPIAATGFQFVDSLSIEAGIVETGGQGDRGRQRHGYEPAATARVGQHIGHVGCGDERSRAGQYLTAQGVRPLDFDIGQLQYIFQETGLHVRGHGIELVDIDEQILRHGQK